MVKPTAKMAELEIVKSQGHQTSNIPYRREHPSKAVSEVSSYV